MLHSVIAAILPHINVWRSVGATSALNYRDRCCSMVGWDFTSWVTWSFWNTLDVYQSFWKILPCVWNLRLVLCSWNIMIENSRSLQQHRDVEISFPKCTNLFGRLNLVLKFHNTITCCYNIKRWCLELFLVLASCNFEGEISLPKCTNLFVRFGRVLKFHNSITCCYNIKR